MECCILNFTMPFTMSQLLIFGPTFYIKPLNYFNLGKTFFFIIPKSWLWSQAKVARPIWWILFVSLCTSKLKKKLIKTYIPLCLKDPIHVCLPSFVWCSKVFNIGMTYWLTNGWIYLDACINIPWVLLLIYSFNIVNIKMIIRSIKHLAWLIMLYLVYIPKPSCKRKFS
jgi:hypothetical protein